MYTGLVLYNQSVKTCEVPLIYTRTFTCSRIVTTNLGLVVARIYFIASGT